MNIDNVAREAADQVRANKEDKREQYVSQYFERNKIDPGFVHPQYPFPFITEIELAEEYFEDNIEVDARHAYDSARDFDWPTNDKFYFTKWGYRVVNCKELWQTVQKLPLNKKLKLIELLCQKSAVLWSPAKVVQIARAIRYQVTPKQRSIFYKILGEDRDVLAVQNNEFVNKYI